MLVFGIFLAALAAIFLLGSIFLCCCNFKGYSIYRNGVRMLFYNTIIRYYLIAMLKITVGSSITLSLLNVQEPQAVWAILMLRVIALSPFVFALTIYLHRQQLYFPSMRSKIGHMYFGIRNRESNFWGLAYSTIFLFRRQFFVVIMFFIPKHPEI